MERKTRSGKAAAPVPPVAVVAPKKRGRKKKSEILEIEPIETPPVTHPARRSTRGRNAEQGISETIMTEADGSSSLISTLKISVKTEEFLEKFEPKKEEIAEVEEAIEVLTNQNMSLAVDDPLQSPEDNVGAFEKSQTQHPEPQQPRGPLDSLEEKMGNVILEEQQESVVTPTELPVKPSNEDVEMKEEAIDPVSGKLDESAESEAIKEESKVGAKDEPPLESQSEFMDLEDDTPSVRRSRRLQSVFIEPAPLKMEENVKTLVSVEAIEQKEEPLPVPPPEPAGVQLKIEIEPKPAPNQHLKVEMYDERLKRYETILDNIFPKKSDKKLCKQNKAMKCDCTITEEEVKNRELGCQYNCINRILYIECGPKCRCGEYCDNQQFQRHNYAQCSVFDTINKGFGIKAEQDIPAETFIIEYVGEVLDNKQFEKRAKKYSENKNIHYYFMALKSNAIIDATKKGNISRFINHSCDPNAETQKWTVNGDLRVGFFSRKDIKKGEEITFDYQYQRYGKEAQKCYCEAVNCRGWIGENPLDEEEEVEGPEIGDAKVKKTKGRKGRKPKATTDKLTSEQELKDDSESEDDEEKARVKEKDKIDRNAAKLKKRQEFDDLEIKGEINELTKSGLKNRAHTLKLSRLVVRANNFEARMGLLKILINGDLPCCRLFLDYNGLMLLHQWMGDVTFKRIPDVELGIQIMNALGILPITNKTVLRTSKILDKVEKWKNLDLEKKKDDAEKIKKRQAKEQAKAEKKKNKKKIEGDQQEEEAKPENPDQTEGETEQAKENVDTSNMQDENAIDEQLINMKLLIKQQASQLLEKWEDLKEDFKIPKKQKQEIMIEHEREADHDDWEDDSTVPPTDALSSDRYKNRFGDDPTHAGANRTFQATYNKKQFDPMVSKQQRRQMFEMKVAQIDTEKRMILAHENNCTIFGLNPTTTNPLDVPVRVNRVTGEYNTIDGRIAPPPPNHCQFKYEPLTLSTNPDDYYLPPIDLPDHWRFALDEYGRIYYYHEKIRQAQWEAPIKILPLDNPEIESDSPDSDESTTETEDSEEEELRELLEILKRKKLLPPVQTSALNPLVLQSTDGDLDDLEKKIMSNMMKNPLDQPLKLNPLPQKRLKRKKHHGLTAMQFIRPRTEADKIYGRAESKRYKEVKEKLRQKKRRILKGEPAEGSSDDEDDDIALDDSIETQRFVDELDILEKSEYDRGKKEVEKRLKKSKPPVIDSNDIKRQFRDEIKIEIAKYLQPYREDSCESGKITNDVDFNSLVNKLTFSVLTKESKHCLSINSMLKATDSVKGKTKEYIKKYMCKFEAQYQRREDEQDYATILNKI